MEGIGSGFDQYGSGLLPSQSYTKENGMIRQSIDGGNGNYVTYQDYTGPSGNGKPVYGETPWTMFNPEGKQIGQGVHKKDKWQDLVAMAGLAALGMGAFLPGMMGGAGGVGAGAGSAAGFVGEGAASGIGAWDAAAGMGAAGGGAGAGAGLGMGLGVDGMAPGLYDFGLGSITDAGIAGSSTTLGTGVQVPWTLGGAGQVGGSAALGGGLPGLLGGAAAEAGGGAIQGTVTKGLGSNLPIGATPGAGTVSASKIASSIPSIPGLTSINKGNGEQSGGMSNMDLAGIITGLMDYRGNKGMSEDMLGYMREQQKKIDDLYAPGSKEWDYLWEAMSRKDAAAGRNSQYGPRSVDFLGKIADTKAKYTADLTKSLAGNYQEAFRRDNFAESTGLGGALKAALKKPENLSSIVNGIKNVGSYAGQSFDDFMGSLFS